jgi:hypothetical protein
MKLTIMSDRHLIERARQVADELGAQAPEKIKTILMALVRRVEVRLDSVKIAVSQSSLAALLSASSIDARQTGATLVAWS